MKRTDARERIELDSGELFDLIETGMVTDDEIEIVVPEEEQLPLIAQLTE